MADKVRRELEETLNAEKPVAIAEWLCANCFNSLLRMTEAFKG